MHDLVFFLISFVASTIGAITGIGGGVLIKPVLDSFQELSVSTISFLSSATVLSMSGYRVLRSGISRDSTIRTDTAVALGIGSAIGGVLGKDLFKRLSAMFVDSDIVGALQSACLLVVTILTFIYTVHSMKISTKHVKNKMLTVLIGVGLGAISAFLGIGGGPMNLIVLEYFFSMDIKTAAQNSLMIILLSQSASLLSTLITRSVPQFSPFLLCVMLIGGISGGFVGRLLNRRMTPGHIRVLFGATMAAIMLLCMRNIVLYLC